LGDKPALADTTEVHHAFSRIRPRAAITCWTRVDYSVRSGIHAGVAWDLQWNCPSSSLENWVAGEPEGLALISGPLRVSW